MSGIRCDVCGRFRPAHKVTTATAEADDGEWIECTDCMSPADLNRYGMTR